MTSRNSLSGQLLDHLIGAREQGVRHSKPLRGGQVDALADLDEAIRVESSARALALYHRVRASIRRNRGDLDGALADFERTLQVEPNNIRAYVGRGITYEKMGDMERAQADYNSAVKRKPTDKADADIIKRARDRLTALPAQAPAPVARTQDTLVAAAPSTPRALFERHDLIGYFAADCSQPVSEQNPFIVHRPNGDKIQRDRMVAQTSRSDASVIDSAAEARPGELTLGMANEHGRLNLVLRLEPQRWLVVESASACTQRA